jgi:hypothetical protein
MPTTHNPEWQGKHLPNAFPVRIANVGKSPWNSAGARVRIVTDAVEEV